jgi:uncharacterized protein (DUF1778 family)
MTTTRWTIRSVRSDAIKVIRVLSQDTGQSAGQLVSRAILSWARTLPLEETPEVADTGDWNRVIADLDEQIAANAQLLRNLNARLAALGSA